MKLKSKTKNIVIPFLGIVVILTLWYGEKTKRIPQYGTTFYEMGLHCKGQCGQDKKIYYFNKAIHYDPDLSGPNYQLALIYEKMGDDAKASKYYRRAADLAPWNIFAAYHAGCQYFREGSYEYARRHFLRCYQRIGCPDDVDYYLARTYDRTNRYEMASRHYSATAVLHKELSHEAYSRWIELRPLYEYPGAWSFSREIGRLRDLSRHDLADQLEKLVKKSQSSGISEKK